MNNGKEEVLTGKTPGLVICLHSPDTWLAGAHYVKVWS